MAVMPYTTDHWRRFFRVAGAAEMADDPRVTDTAERSRHIGMLYGMVSDLIATRPTAEWVKILDDADIPSVPIQSIDDLPEDPHLKATGFFVDYEHPSEGPLRTTAPPTVFSTTPSGLHRVPPRLGEHTTDVLRELGYDQQRIDALIASGAACAEPAQTPSKTAAGPTL
jgi:crotonobetainyl-CoA:carnitine CoA-transferase CaiB-like acyl-CoA transferase